MGLDQTSVCAVRVAINDHRAILGRFWYIQFDCKNLRIIFGVDNDAFFAPPTLPLNDIYGMRAISIELSVFTPENPYILDDMLF